LIITLVLFFGSAVAIYLACEFFVNGVEWVGQRFNLSQNATGTVLAAFGTALPESVVTFVAVVFGKTPSERDIGVGAAIGGPLVLSTVAYAVVGLALILPRASEREGRQLVDADCRRLSRDQSWFLGIFICTLALGLIGFTGKEWLGFVLLGAYALYVLKELRQEAGAETELEPLKIRPRDGDPGVFWALLQTTGALLVIFLASHIFVGQLDVIGPWLGLPSQLVALLLSPVATEMPEIMNAVIWVRQGRERMALANISGAMMIQATVPAAFGLFFTPWIFSRPLVIAAVVTVLAVIALLSAFRSGAVAGRRLTWSGLLYIVFAGALFAY
jgi:cation:H+ antiporter